MGWMKCVVYRSRDKDDWEKAKRLLEEAGIEHYPFAAEEVPVAGCGAKINPGRFINKGKISSCIYRIEVSSSNQEKAENILSGKVMPVLSIGFSL